MSNDIIIFFFKNDIARKPTFIEVPSPTVFSSSLIALSSPIQETAVARRKIPQGGYPARFSTIRKAFNPETNRHFHLNKLQQYLEDLEGTNNDINEQSPITATIPYRQAISPLKSKKDQPLKYLRRHMTVNGDTNSLKGTTPQG